MTTYTVIWRDTGDEFIVTALDLHENVANDMTSQDFVLAAATLEHEGSEEELAEWLEDIKTHGYELIGIFAGDVDWIQS
jgi:hypothetical protein